MLLAGLVASASVRSLIPGTFLFVVAMIVGAHFPGALGLIVAIVCVMGMGVVAACWGCAIALKLQDPVGGAADAGRDARRGPDDHRLRPPGPAHRLDATVAKYNPVTQVVEAARQGFVGGVTWAGTWPGLVVIVGLTALLGAWALRGMRRTAY